MRIRGNIFTLLTHNQHGFICYPKYTSQVILVDQLSTHFLQKINSIHTLPPNCQLVTLDVTSLYTNIPHNEGIASCTEALSNRDIQEPPTEHLGTLISFILRKNSFVFGKKHYLQINGTAMGTRMAPSYANLFMAQLEESFLERSTCRRPFVWWRYIDDIFLI